MKDMEYHLTVLGHTVEDKDAALAKCQHDLEVAKSIDMSKIGDLLNNGGKKDPRSPMNDEIVPLFLIGSADSKRIVGSSRRGWRLSSPAAI